MKKLIIIASVFVAYHSPPATQSKALAKMLKASVKPLRTKLASF